MSLLVHLLPLLACLHVVRPYPVREEEGSLLDSYEARLAKKSFYPYKESILSPLGFLEGSRIGGRGQRKKAVDSTFIRFGRGSTAEHSGRNERSLDEQQHPLFDESSSGQQEDHHLSEEVAALGLRGPAEDPQEGFRQQQQRFLLSHGGCRISSAQDLRKALLGGDPGCFRSQQQRAKKENVNDTFIRFGKREAPPEKELEKNSNGSGTR